MRTFTVLHDDYKDILLEEVLPEGDDVGMVQVFMDLDLGHRFANLLEFQSLEGYLFGNILFVGFELCD